MNTFPFSRTFGAGTHELATTDLNVLVDTSAGAVNFILPSINDTMDFVLKQGYSSGAVGVFPMNITDISDNASVNNITVTAKNSDKFSGNIPSVVINENSGSYYFKPSATNIWSIINSGTGGGSQYLPCIDVTWSQLNTLVTNSLLIECQKYNITDFRTRENIPETADVHLGNIEPITVTADSVNTLSGLATSSIYTNDTLVYELNDSTSQGGDRGRISFRKDNVLNISAYYDWRNIVFRRWETAPASGIYTSITDNGEAFQDFTTFDITALNNFKIYDILISNCFDKSFVLPNTTFQGIDVEVNSSTFEFGLLNNTFLDVCIGCSFGINFRENKIIGEFTDTKIGAFFSSNFVSYSYNNTIGNYASSNVIDNGFIFNQIGDEFVGNQIGTSFQYSNIGGQFQNSQIGDNFINNTIGNYFNNNTIGIDFNYNTIGYGFGGNIIGGNFNNNTIGNGFGSNTIGDNFIDNTIGNSFGNNTIGIDFNYNTIGYAFQSNTTGGNFNNNTIGNAFQSNIIGDSFYSNSIGDDFGNNTIGDSFYSNSIGTDFLYNTIGNNFNNNTIENGFDTNTIGNSFDTNSIGNSFDTNSIGDNFNYNTIGNDFTNNTIGINFYNNTIGINFNNNTIGIDFNNNTIGNGFNNNIIVNDFKFNTIKYIVQLTDFSLANYVYANYNCEIFQRSDNTLQLSFIDGTNTIQYAAINA